MRPAGSTPTSTKTSKKSRSQQSRTSPTAPSSSRNNRWVDSPLLKQENEKPDRTIEFGSPEYMKLLEDLAKDNRQVALSLGGDVLMQVGKERVLVKGP